MQYHSHDFVYVMFLTQKEIRLDLHTTLIFVVVCCGIFQLNLN